MVQHGYTPPLLCPLLAVQDAYQISGFCRKCSDYCMFAFTLEPFPKLVTHVVNRAVPMHYIDRKTP